MIQAKNSTIMILTISSTLFLDGAIFQFLVAGQMCLGSAIEKRAQSDRENNQHARLEEKPESMNLIRDKEISFDQTAQHQAKDQRRTRPIDINHNQPDQTKHQRYPHVEYGLR